MKSLTLLSFPVLVGLFVLVVLASCVSSDAEMNAFVGQSSSTLLSRLGPPKLRIPEGQGGQIWTYVDERQSNAPIGAMHTGSINGYGGGSAPRPSSLSSTQFSSSREFYIDASGTIYKYRGKAR